MKRKLTLNEAWDRCLAMWKWIAKQDDVSDVDRLKRQWLRTQQKKYRVYELSAACFFCEYAVQNREGPDDNICLLCPGVLIDEEFWCVRSKYSCEYEPRAFYKKLVELNNERLKRKNVKTK